MFSPSSAQGGPATATRSRRRQRPVSSERTTQQPKAKRQRLPLTEQTFVNPEAGQEMIEVKADTKVATLPAKNKTINIEPPEPVSPVLRKELNVRTKKAKHGDRAANKGDGSLVLVRRRNLFLLRPCRILIVLYRQAQTPTRLASYQLCPTEFAPTGQVS